MSTLEVGMMLDRLKGWAYSIRRETHALYIAASHPRTPWYAKALALAIAAYALSPIDLIPDFIPVVGFVDEVLLLPLAIAGVLKLVPADVIAESRKAAAVAAKRPVSWTAAAVIPLIWILAIVGSGVATYHWYFGF